ncbi:Putative SOS response-associated peptidase YedK [Rhizobiales bacterium GAS188]|nr:Putative SOS response-associated peptidase YedK [Rhizobiales bacterium GAS188]
MCGRYAITSSPELLRDAFGYVEQPNFPPRYNIAPTQPVPIIRRERRGDGVATRHFVLVRFGFIPAFVKDPKSFPLIINARSETALDKPSFRAALMRRRCLFIADAFYEWQAGRKPKRVFMLRRPDATPFAMAGLWECWMGQDGSEIDTACILTTTANGTLAALHERMPVIIDPKDYGPWLDCDGVEAREAIRLARPAADEALELIEVSQAVNRVANDGPFVQAPLRG